MGSHLGCLVAWLLGCLVASIETTKYLVAANGFTKLATTSKCTAIVEQVDQNSRF